MKQNPQYEPRSDVGETNRIQTERANVCRRGGDEVRRMVEVFRCRTLRKSSIYPAESPLSDLNRRKFQRKRQREAVELSCGMWHNASV